MATYTVDNNTIDEIQTHYARILDQAALNVASPLAANVGFFNTTGKVFADPPKIGKTVVFMTRPNLNLRDPINFQRSRIFKYFGSNKIGTTMMRYLMFPDIAANLVYDKYDGNGTKVPIIGTANDTVLGGSILSGNQRSFPMLKSNFIPAITNLCTNVSNGKDMTLDVFETEGDFNGNKLQYAAGMDENFSTGEVTLTFDNIYSAPVDILFTVWLMYMHYVGKGINNPEWAYIVNRIIDYTTSVYVFVLDTDQQTILRWTSYSGLFPRSYPYGQIQHDVNIDKQAMSNISVPCAYNFSSPMDPIVLTKFNMLAGPSLAYRFDKNMSSEQAAKLKKMLEGHTLSTPQAMYIREVCPAGKGFWSGSSFKQNYQDIPDKRLYMKKNFINDVADTFTEDKDGSVSTIDPNSMRRLNLKNREMNNMDNNWGGVPYIVDGNKLMWL